MKRKVPQKRIIPREQVLEWYKAVANGLFIGFETEKESIEHELFRAAKEGRIR